MICSIYALELAIYNVSSIYASTKIEVWRCWL